MRVNGDHRIHLVLVNDQDLMAGNEDDHGWMLGKGHEGVMYTFGI
jgi:hypothetical protein